MEDRRRAELLIVHLRWLALIAGAFMIDDYALTASAAVVIFGVFLCNAAATHIVADKSLFSRYGYIASPATRCVDLIGITLAAHLGCDGSQDLYLLYGFVIVGTGYVYNRLLPTITLLGVSLLLDSAFIRVQLGSANVQIGSITQHAAAHLAAALIATYIIAFRRQDESMRMKERKLSALFECGTRFTSAQDIHQLLNHVLDTAISETGAAGGCIALLNSDHELVPEIVKGRDGAPAKEQPDLEVLSAVVSAGQPMLLNPGESEENLDSQNLAQKPTVCVPLVDRSTDDGARQHEQSASKIIGALSVHAERFDPGFGHEDLDLLRSLGIHASMGLVNVRLYRELHDTFLKTLQSLARSLEARDPYTQGHSFRVSEIARLVARELDLPPEPTEILRNAALLHDIGKIGVPDSVLQKPSRLTQQERLVIQTHPVTGENICRPLDLSEEVLFLIRHHQERLNGSGYPDQLPADEQPLPLRILCAVDTLDAMSSDRPYRKALTATQRVEQLNRAAGSEFDPVVVEVLKSLLTSGELDRFYTENGDNGTQEKEEAA